MPLIVADLCRMTDLLLVPVVGFSGLSNRISWIIATDHLNPKK